MDNKMFAITKDQISKITKCYPLQLLVILVFNWIEIIFHSDHDFIKQTFSDCKPPSNSFYNSFGTLIFKYFLILRFI